jgi:hypothetical protein
MGDKVQCFVTWLPWGHEAPSLSAGLHMPIYQLENIPEEFVTPKHSTAYGRLITGTQVEVGLLRYKAGEGAKQHAHPHEQILLVLRRQGDNYGQWHGIAYSFQYAARARSLGRY